MLNNLKNVLLNVDFSGNTPTNFEVIIKDLLKNKQYNEFLVNGSFYIPCIDIDMVGNINNINDFKSEFLKYSSNLPICYKDSDISFPVSVNMELGFDIGLLNERYNLGLDSEVYGTMVIPLSELNYNYSDLVEHFEYQTNIYNEMLKFKK